MRAPGLSRLHHTYSPSFDVGPMVCSSCFAGTTIAPAVNVARVCSIVDLTPFVCFSLNDPSTVASVTHFEPTSKIRAYLDQLNLSPGTQARSLRHYRSLPEVFDNSLHLESVGPPSLRSQFDSCSFSPFRQIPEARVKARDVYGPVRTSSTAVAS